MTENRAKWWRERIELAASTMTDKNASQSAELFPSLKYDGALVTAGMRIDWNGVLKVARADLWDTEENNPDNAPTLWRDLPYKDGIRVIEYPIEVTNPFHLDELGWWGDNIYKSLVETNVYTPEEYPRNWEFVQGDKQENEPVVEPEVHQTEEPTVDEPEYKTIYRNASVDKAFGGGEIGIWEDGKLYKSLINANVYTPETYPMGWELVE